MTKVTDACRFEVARDSHAVPETVPVLPRPEPVGREHLRCAFGDRPIASGRSPVAGVMKMRSSALPLQVLQGTNY